MGSNCARIRATENSRHVRFSKRSQHPFLPRNAYTRICFRNETIQQTRPVAVTVSFRLSIALQRDSRSLPRIAFPVCFSFLDDKRFEMFLTERCRFQFYFDSLSTKPIYAAKVFEPNSLRFFSSFTPITHGWPHSKSHTTFDSDATCRKQLLL